MRLIHEMEDLWKIRQRKGMSLPLLANKTGIPQETLLAYEMGKQEIPPAHLARLAKVLYVSEADIKPLSSPPPWAKPAAPPLVSKPAPPPEQAPPPRVEEIKKRVEEVKKEEKPAKKPAVAPGPVPKPQAPPPPISGTQMEAILSLARKLGIDLPTLESRIGKSLPDLTKEEGRQLYDSLVKERLETLGPPLLGKRSALPEGLDLQEFNYLTKAQEAGTPLTFTLFNGQVFTGVVTGFSLYTITIRQENGDEVTLNKLAIAYYRKAARRPEELTMPAQPAPQRTNGNTAENAEEAEI